MTSELPLSPLFLPFVHLLDGWRERLRERLEVRPEDILDDPEEILVEKKS